MGLVRCLEAYLIRTSKPPPYNPELLQGLRTERLFFAYQDHRVHAKTVGIFLLKNNWTIEQNPAI